MPAHQESIAGGGNSLDEEKESYHRREVSTIVSEKATSSRATK
jgi:hypothetical protein